MNKSNVFTGQPILGQLLKLVDRTEVMAIARHHKADRYYKKFKTHSHLVCMLFAVLSRCEALRELSTAMLACQGKLNHLGLKYIPKRSTISDGNKNRSSVVFRDIYKSLYKKYIRFLPDSSNDLPMLRRLFLLDSTTIGLFKEILKTGGPKSKSGRQKGGIKAHTVIRGDMSVPTFVQFSSAVTHDKQFIDKFSLSAGDFICVDRAYWDYKQFATWTERGIFFVTRMKKLAKYEIVSEFDISEEQIAFGIQSHQIVTIGSRGRQRVSDKRTTIKRVVFIDPKSNKKFVFMTNHIESDAVTITNIYKHRWHIEKLFKKLKQNFPLKYFLGDNVNAIEIQIWVSFIAMLLLSILKNQVSRKWAFSNLVSLVSFHLMAYIDVVKFLNNPQKAWIEKNESKHAELSLFSSA